MKNYNRLTKAWATISTEKANQNSHKKDIGYLLFACVFLLIGIYALSNIF